MADQIDEVKQKTDIVALISGYITLKKAGRNYKANCPFHSEKTPSFMVSPELQIYKCFGCGETGDAFSFLEKYEGMEFGEALNFLADRAGIKLQQTTYGQYNEKEKLFEINLLALKFYNYILLNHRAGKEALYYLTRERGLKLDTLKKFKLGFSPRKEDVLANYFINRKKYKSDDLIKAGLVYRSSYGLSDRFFGRVIFPLFDHRGNVIGFAGRLLPKDDNGERGKYINSPDTSVYHKSRVLYGLDMAKTEIKKNREAVVVEGELDTISSWQAGIKNVIAIKGSALTDDQIKLISRFADKLILALDSDFAGDAAARKGIANAFGSGLEIKVANLEGFKDPDEMARKNPEGLKSRLDSPVGIWDFFINSAFNKYNAKTGEGSSKISKSLVPILSSIPDRIVQAHYIDIVAKKLNVPVSAVSEEVLVSKPSLVAKETDADKTIANQEKRGRRELLEDRLMILLFLTEAKLLLEKKYTQLIKDRLNLRLIEELKKYFEKEKEFNTSGFAKNLPKELFDGYSKIVLTDHEDLTKDPEKLNKELDLVQKEIKILNMKEEITLLSLKISEFEKSKEKEKLEKVKQKFSELIIKLNELEESNGKGIILT